MRKYVIMGAQGSGKGTQAKLLAKDFDLVHISVGDVFRWHVQNHTKLGARVKRIVANGKNQEAYMCGPTAMIDAAITTLQRLGVEEQKIFYDKFVTKADTVR